MNTIKQFGIVPLLVSALVAGSLLLAACAPGATTTPPAHSSAPTQTGAPDLPAATEVSARHFSLNTGSVAASFQTETVAAVSASDNGPYWNLLPEYTRVTLEGYPIINSAVQPQIFIYPLKELGQVNEGAGRIAAALQTLLQSQGDEQYMPFMPLYNAQQVFHARVQYLDFKSGKGVRYLTQFDQAPLPVNNNELIYTFQGVTKDGKYYLAAVLPVNQSSLPADEKITGNEPPELKSDFPTYLANMTKMLNSADGKSFTPDLTQLDALMSSVEIK